MICIKFIQCFLFVAGFLSTNLLFASPGIKNNTEDLSCSESLESLTTTTYNIFELSETQNENQPLVDVDNLDKFPAKDHLAFSRIQIPWQRKDQNGNLIGTVNANHDLVTVRITNKGAATLRIDDLTISNNDFFVIDKIVGTTYSGSLPVNLTSRQFIDVTIKFVAVNPGSWKWIKILHENLTIVSNDPLNPSKLVYLHGLWQLQGEDKYEPTAQDMIDAFGFKTRTGFGMKDPDKGNPAKLKGDEVLSPYFVRADLNKPVYVRQMAAYHGCCTDTETFRYNIKGTTERTNIVQHRREDGQSILPRLPNSNNPAEKSFVPHVEVFGFNVNRDYTDPALNIHPNFPDQNNKIGVRIWKVLDAQGNVVPNAYILANDYLGSQWTNYDYNDNMYYVSNIKPEVGTVHYSELSPNFSSFDFGKTETGSTHNKTLNLTSLGKTYGNGTSDPVIKIIKVEVVGLNKNEFVATNPAALNLDPQASTSLNIQFKPATSGFKIADLLIHYNMGDSPLRIPLYAIATDDCKEITEHLRIKSGSDANVTSGGKTWISDKTYRSGNVKLDVPPAHVNQIAGTDDDIVYINYLSSNADHNIIKYAIPLTVGEYMVRLHFSENYWSKPGERVFTISMENDVKLANFDILKEVKPRTALVKNIPVTVSDGTLNIDFTPTVNRLSIAAIEIYKVNDGAGITLTTAVEGTTCNLQNGTINASAGNSQQVSYKLGADGVYQSSGVFENLAAGTYTVFAKSGSADCEASIQAIVSEGECQNQKPVVNNPIVDQAAKEGSPFSFTFPANTFQDPDPDDVLTYSATLADNAALPSWLTFNPSSRSFTGTPGSDNIGTIEIKVTATDKQGASVSDYFLVVISGINDPFIEVIEDITTMQDTPAGPIQFTISAGDQPMGNLSLTADSDNNDLIPDDNIVIEGNGTARTFTITPAAGKSGSANVTIFLNGNNTEASRTFKVTVLTNNNNSFPAISAIDDVVIQTNTSTGPISFIITDENNDEDNLIVTATSDNQDLVPDGNIVLGGSGSNRTVTVTPLEDKNGNVNITIQVSDGESEAETTFNVKVSPINSIGNEKLETKIKLYPNPAQNNLTVQLENNYSGTTQLLIIDTKGKILRSFTFEKNNNSVEYNLNLDPINSGTYIIKIQQKDTVSFRKFIKY